MKKLLGVSWGEFFRTFYKELDKDQVFNGAAAVAYYLLLSLFPAAIFLLTILPYLPIPELEPSMVDTLMKGLPHQSGLLFRKVLDEVMSQQKGQLLSFGFLLTLWTGSNAIYVIIQELNFTYNVKESRPYWKVRGLSIALLVFFILLIVAAFTLIIFGEKLQGFLASYLAWGLWWNLVFSLFRWIVVVFLLLFTFALTYYLGPNVKQSFRFITPGSVLASIGLILASLLFSLYIDNFTHYEASYGSLGAVIILMLWLYIIGFVILAGSEINALIEYFYKTGKSKAPEIKDRKAD